jgi:pimeloyl-ACP methyl ester carboxylesterase
MTREIVGRYVTLAVGEDTTDVFYEETGDGVPLVCLHTAGADSRQFHDLLRHPALDGYRTIAFDLPAHGRSYPLGGWWRTEYQLTQETYRSIILSFCETLELDRPVILGCSMAAAIVADLAVRHGSRFRAAVGLGAPARAENRRNPFLTDPRCDASVVAAAYTLGLHAPGAPEQRVHENAWIYAQGGPGVYDGDLVFYSQEWDATATASGPRDGSCPLYLLAGEYDYSCLPSSAREAAALLEAEHFSEMAGLGHFSMIEDVDRLLEHLHPLLVEIRSGQARSHASKGLQ